MANSYLQFSETLDDLTPEEAAWLGEQFASIVVIDGKEFLEDDDAVPNRDTEPSYRGLRFLRDYEHDPLDDPEHQGFEYDLQTDDDHGRYAWLHADDCGEPDRVAHLVRKFLKRFRPDQCWSLSYAATCSKPRVGEFGGGAVFVTADKVSWECSYDFIEQQRAAFEATKPAPAATA